MAREKWCVWWWRILRGGHSLYLLSIVKQILFSFAHLRWVYVCIFRNERAYTSPLCHRLNTASALHSAFISFLTSHFHVLSFFRYLVTIRILISLRFSFISHNFFFLKWKTSSIRYLCCKWSSSVYKTEMWYSSGWRVQLCLTKFTVNWYFIIKLQCGWFTLSGGLIVSVHFMSAWTKVFRCRFAVKCVHYTFECINSDERKSRRKKNTRFIASQRSFFVRSLVCCFSSIYVARLMVFCGKFMHFRGYGTAINSKPTAIP